MKKVVPMGMVYILVAMLLLPLTNAIVPVEEKVVIAPQRDNIFYTPFDDESSEIDFFTDVIGNDKPLVYPKIDYSTDGIIGKAFSQKDNRELIYAEGSNLNLNPQIGTIEFWIRPEWDIENVLKAPAGFFCENNYWSGKDIAIGIMGRDGGIQAEVSNLSSYYGHLHSIRWWNKGEWHQIAFTWQTKTGRVDTIETKLYIDGMLFSTLSCEGSLTGQDKFYIGRFPWGCGGPFGPCVNFSIDEFKIYNRKLDSDEIKEHYIKLFPVEYHAKETVFYTTRIGQRVEVSIKNIAQQAITGHFRCTVNGSTRSKWIELQPNEIYTFKGAEAPLFPNVADPGEHYLDCYFGISSGPDVYPLYGWHKRTIRLFAIPSEEQPSKPETEKLELDWDNVTFIDCVEVPPTHPYFHSDAEVHTWPNWYTYRRTGKKNGDRFGYQFEIPQDDIDVGRPYLVVVDYPALEDDPDLAKRARTMEIDILEPHEGKYGPVIQTGVFTGNEYPCDWPSENILKQQRIIFWPQTTKNLITIVNRWDDHRAAALRIWIFPIKGDEAHGWFPKTNVIMPPDGGRLLGLWWEEPQIYKNFGAPNQTITGFYEALKHMIDYLHYTGQNQLIYPIYFYHDPIYPSRIEGWPVWGEKGEWHPDAWFELMLKMCEANNISVVASFAIKTIPSLESDDS